MRSDKANNQLTNIRKMNLMNDYFLILYFFIE